MSNIIKAIQKINPTAEVSVSAEDINQITWENETTPIPFASWILNEETCQWEAPVAYPDDDNRYTWNESNQTWDLVE